MRILDCADKGRSPRVTRPRFENSDKGKKPLCDTAPHSKTRSQSDMSESIKKFEQTLRDLGFANQIITFMQPAKTSAEAAAAVGCEVGQIAKSLVFKGLQSEQAILVIASGVNRVNEKVLSLQAAEKVGKADADFVRLKTGFVIGGVPPVGHAEKLRTFIDEDLLQYEVIWAAAGTPYAVFKLTPRELVAMTRGTVTPIK